MAGAENAAGRGVKVFPGQPGMKRTKGSPLDFPGATVKRERDFQAAVGSHGADQFVLASFGFGRVR
jgi:hypothetical protein